MESDNSIMEEDSPTSEPDEPNKLTNGIENCSDFINDSDKVTLLDSSKDYKSPRQVLTKNLKELTESPRTKLAKFIPDVPFQLNGRDHLNNQLCDGKIFIQKSVDIEDNCNGGRNVHVSISFDELDDTKTFSKSYDYNDENSSLQEHYPGMSRSLSEDYMQQPTANYTRRISVASTKGKLLGVPRVRPGEKLVRSPSIISQLPSRPPPIVSSEKPEETVKKKFTTEQKLVAFCLCLVDFTSFLSMSIIAPFFPKEAAAKGMREAVSGFVFSIYALVMMLTSPIFGKLLPIVGAKFMFLSGVFLCGSCNVIFGVLDKVDGQMEFTVLCFVVRSFEAVGSAAFCTASCTILIDQFPDNIGTVFGFAETCIGIGMSIGPAIGGALYTVGGFGLPFFILGGFVISIVPLCWFLMRSVEDPEAVLTTQVSYMQLLSKPHVIIVCLILAVSSQSQGFIDPTLEPHMRQYGLNTGVIGLLFLLLSGAYAVSSPIVGWVCGKVENKYPIMLVGLAVVTVGLLLVGPSQLLPITGSVWLSTVALTIMGFSFAAAYVPTFESLLIAAMNGGLEDDINTYSVVSGLWNSVYSLGEVTGPSLGGILSDFFTFPEASTYMAICTLAAFLVGLVAWMNPCFCFGPYSLVEDAEEKLVMSVDVPSREHTPLQDGNVHNYGSMWKEKNPSV